MTSEEIFKTMQDLLTLKTVGDCVRYLTAKLN